MSNVLIINTGGTFNKKHNRVTGDYEMTQGAIENMFDNWLNNTYPVINIINKDSLEFTDNDREELLELIKSVSYKKIVVVHGTDTLNISAEMIAQNFSDKVLDIDDGITSQNFLDKTIVFTGAMTPYYVDEIEATANLASSIGYVKGQCRKGVYIALNGCFGAYNKVEKDRLVGKFVFKENI